MRLRIGAVWEGSGEKLYGPRDRVVRGRGVHDGAEGRNDSTLRRTWHLAMVLRRRFLAQCGERAVNWMWLLSGYCGRVGFLKIIVSPSDSCSASLGEHFLEA